jgi:hypothetical protein
MASPAPELSCPCSDWDPLMATPCRRAGSPGLPRPSAGARISGRSGGGAAKSAPGSHEPGAEVGTFIAMAAPYAPSVEGARTSLRWRLADRPDGAHRPSGRRSASGKRGRRPLRRPRSGTPLRRPCPWWAAPPEELRHAANAAPRRRFERASTWKPPGGEGLPRAAPRLRRIGPAHRPGEGSPPSPRGRRVLPQAAEVRRPAGRHCQRNTGGRTRFQMSWNRASLAPAARVGRARAFRGRGLPTTTSSQPLAPGSSGGRALLSLPRRTAQKPPMSAAGALHHRGLIGTRPELLGAPTKRDGDRRAGGHR